MKHALAAAALLVAGASHAAAVDNATGIVGATNTITFSEAGLAADTVVTNQYATYGASFTPNLDQSPQAGFFAGDYLGNFDFYNGTGIASPFEIDFTHAVNGAAFQFISNPGTTTFEALLNGNVVESFSAATSTATQSYYGFDGVSFDAIRVTVGGSGSAMLLDNLQFRTSSVPEPASLALLGLGLAAVALRARRKA
ncbi:MAG: PEP-CTERM sorting domain-containing protein [Betaproteobacteria bacterium]